VRDNPNTQADESNHEDAGKAYSGNAVCLDPPTCSSMSSDAKYTALFNSDGSACPASSCSDATPGACACYDASGTTATRKSALATSSCCGDDANEWYKKDYYGGECVGNAASNVNDCVWSDGMAQASNTGNKEYWCYTHEWDNCIQDADIGTKTGGVTCAGTSSSKAWTPNANVLTEDRYSCTDSLDNDGDGKKDCADTDCAGSISGTVQDTNNQAIELAKIEVLQNAQVKYTAYTDSSGNYPRGSVQSEVDAFNSILCGTYNIIASEADYISSTKENIDLPASGSITVDFTGTDALVLGTSCEADCTYAGDNLIHKECQGINGCDLCSFNCDFCDANIASEACNLAQTGWIRAYNDPSQPECQATGCVIECGESCPIAKVETKASVTCEDGNLIKVTKLVIYKGKLAKLVVVTCG